LDARYDTPFANQNILNGSVIATLGVDNTKVVVPKDIWRSALFQRMVATNSLFKMPPLARNLVDSNAVPVIAAWINQLPGTPALSPPVITPAGGTFNNPQSVIIQHSDQNAKLFYTLDGSLPNTNSIPYSGPFTVTNTVTVKAVATQSGFNKSVATTASFALGQSPLVQIVAYTNNQLSLSWPGDPTSYVLEVTDSLAPPVTWTTAPEQPGASGGQTSVNLPTTARQKFYRLRR